jgi:SAM-dependent methyltransferase
MIVSGPAGPEEGGMPADILCRLAERMDAHPWWRHRCRLAAAVLAGQGIQPPARILDIGCGSGLTLKALEARGYPVVGIDAVRTLLERLDGPGRLLVHADVTGELPPSLGTFDAVLLLDVIEHLDDEGPVLAAATERLKPGGLLLVTVPARPDLFSTFDAVQGHRRRYTREALQAVLERAGFIVERPLFWSAWMVPLVWLRRRERVPLSDSPAAQYERFLGLPPAPLSWLLEAAFWLDHHWTLRGLNRTGTSLIAVARRR